MKVKYEELKETIMKALVNNNIDEDKAKIMSELHTESTLKGVNSHGIDRIPRLIDFVKEGLINKNGDLKILKSFGAIEAYDGNLGFGSLNALKASDRVIELATKYGIGMVTVRNTTHWMRAGSYVEKIAENNLIGLAWTNTESVLPVWGSDEVSIGNNPMAISIPSDTGNIILDMAMSQYSYGKLNTTKLAGELLPFEGGYDSQGNLTKDPSEIESTQRLLPIGYWKGSGLAIALDAMAALLSNGKSTYHMDKEDTWNCTSCSQIFIAMNPEVYSTKDENEETIKLIKDSIKNANPIIPGSNIRYPGEGLINRKKRNSKDGIEVNDDVYQKIVSYSK